MLDTVVERFEVVRGSVARDWIDVNGHKNVVRKQGPLPRPKQAGRTIEIRNPLYMTE